jgi:hypothetical protein
MATLLESKEHTLVTLLNTAGYSHHNYSNEKKIQVYTATGHYFLTDGLKKKIEELEKNKTCAPSESAKKHMNGFKDILEFYSIESVNGQDLNFALKEVKGVKTERKKSEDGYHLILINVGNITMNQMI